MHCVEAVLLKLHVKLTQGWALIWVNFDPMQEIGVKSKGWVLFHETTVHVYGWSLFYWVEWSWFNHTIERMTYKHRLVCWIPQATRCDTCFDAGLCTSWNANVTTDNTVTVYTCVGKYSLVSACMLLVFCFQQIQTRVLDRVTFTNRHLPAWLLT